MWKLGIHPLWMAFILSTLLHGAPRQAHADILLYSENSQVQGLKDNGWHSVKLNGSGDIELLFTNTSPGLVSITFSAECQVTGNQLDVLTINILVDNDVLIVTNSSDSLCTGAGAGVGASVKGGSSMRSFTAAVDLTAGDHLLRVDAHSSSSNGSKLDDMAILVRQ